MNFWAVGVAITSISAYFGRDLSVAFLPLD